jgi:hypothetical protein
VHNYIVNLAGEIDPQTVTVSLGNVTDSAGNFSSAVSASMDVLIDGIDATCRVYAADVSVGN